MTDGKNILIEIVFDPHLVVNAGTDGHTVSNAIEYSATRHLIERLKAGDDNISLPLTIVVQKKSLLCGFEDVLGWPATLVNYRDASLRPSLQKLLGAPLSEDITDERLLAWGIRSVSDLPTEGVEPHELDEEWLIDCVLEKVTNCKVWTRASLLANENWMIDWFDFLLTGNIKHLYSDDYLMRVVGKRTKQWSKAYSDEVPDDLVELLFEAMSRRSGGQVARQIITRSLLRQYGSGHTRVLITNLSGLLGAWIKKRLSARAKSTMDQLTAQLYAGGRLNTLVQELDRLVRQEMDELNSEVGLDRYIDHMSGFFPSEYQSVVRRFYNSLIDDYKAEEFDPKAYHASLSLIVEKFSLLLTNKAILAENHQEWIDDLLTLARTLHHLRSATPVTMEQWRKTCTSMMRCEDLLYRLRRERPPDLDAIVCLEDEFAGFNKDLNNDYGDWLLSKFPEYLDNPDQARLVTQTTRLATEVVEVPETVILLVVDGLRWDWWQCLARHLAERGYQIESSDSMGLAMLPTVTNVSRRAALGRFPLSQLINFVDDVYGADVNPDEEALLAARVLGYADQLRHIKSTPNKKIKYLPDQYVYVNGATEDIQQALRLPARHYVVIHTGIDRAAHSESEEQVLRETISTSLRLLAKTLADEIDRNHHLDPNALRLIVTADHGCAHTRWSKQKSLPAALKPYTEPDPHIERHGRIAQVVVAGDAEEVETVKRQVKVFYEENKDEWYAIWGEDAAKYGLPERDKRGRHVIAWLSPRNMDYLRRGNGLYVHGGFSLYETIVPLAVLRYSRERRFIVPTVLFTSGLDTLRNEKPSTILVSIGNDNNQELTGVLSIPELRVKEFEIEPIPPGDTVPTEVPVNPALSGEVSLSVTLRYRVGLSEEMEWSEQYTVDIGISRREQMELETKRELF